VDAGRVVSLIPAPVFLLSPGIPVTFCQSLQRSYGRTAGIPVRLVVMNICRGLNKPFRAQKNKVEFQQVIEYIAMT
jgi:hypothetical protein